MAYLGFVPPGVVLPFAGATAPQGWILCNGAAVSRSTYAALFSAVSTAHGSGDGSTTFNLPDYRGRIMRGVDGGIARDPDRASRTASNAGGNTGDNVGSVQGQATKTPASAFTTAAQTVTGTISATNLNHSHDIFGRDYAFEGIDARSGFSRGRNTSANTNDTTISTSIDLNHSHGHSLTSPASTVNGGGDAETRPINAYVNYIIKI